MNEERIGRIQQASTNQELDRATDGYWEQVLLIYPAFRKNDGFNVGLHDRQYCRALADVRHAAWGRGDRYQDVIRVLEAATERKSALDGP